MKIYYVKITGKKGPQTTEAIATSQEEADKIAQLLMETRQCKIGISEQNAVTFDEFKVKFDEEMRREELKQSILGKLTEEEKALIVNAI